MKQLLKASIALSWILLTLDSQGSELTGRVVSVSDGDTLRILVDDQQTKIRLGG